MGMTVVDALVVTLGLDAAAFKRGKAEASQETKKLTAEEARAAKEIEDRNKRAAESFKGLRREVLALVALFTAGLGIKGLADFTSDTIKGAIATGQLSRELGMVPGELRAVEKSFDRLGASAGDADEALKGIQEQAAKLKSGKAEASQETKKLTAEEARAAKEIEDRNKRAAESFKGLRREVLALVALFTAGLGIKGLADFTSDTIKGAIATGQLSRELGMVPGELRAVEKSFDRLGASAGDADEALKGIQEQAAKLKSGEFDNRLQAYLLNASRAGVSADVQDVNDPIKKLQRDAEIAQKLAQTQGNGFAILAMQQEGYTRAMAYALMQGPQALQAEMARQRKLNELSQQESDRLRALDNRWKDFKDGISNTAQRVVIAMAPVFETIMKLLERLSNWFNAHADQIGAQVGEWAEQFAAWATSVNWNQLISDVKELFRELDKAVESLGGWKTVLVALLGLKILSMVSPVLQLASALGGLGGSLSAIAAVGVPAALTWLALHSEDLNKGEDAELKKRREQAGDTWKGDPGGDARRAANAPNASVAERQQYVFGRLKAAGYTDAQASGIVGSLMQESQLDPRAVNKSSGAAGIAQWLGPRARQFEQQFGHTVAQSTIGEQTDFMLWELKNTEKRAGDTWKGDPGGDARRAANAPNASVAERQQYVFGRLKAAGYTDAQASGIVGSLMQESQLDPRAVNKSSGAAGIAQWLGPRARQFEQQFGHTVAQSTIGEQTDFMLWELKNTEKRADKFIRMAKTPEQAADIHAHEYERPGADEANIARRKAYAQQVYAGVGQANARAIARQSTVAPAAALPSSGVPTSTTTNETTISGPITIQTAATDANGIARDFGQAVQRQTFVAQANTGLS